MTINEMITDLTNTGHSYDEIAKLFSTALNEHEKSARIQNEKSDYLDELLDNIEAMCINDTMTYEAAADVATIALHDKHEELSADKLKSFNKLVLDLLNTADEMETDPKIQKMMDEVASIFKKGTTSAGDAARAFKLTLDDWDKVFKN